MARRGTPRLVRLLAALLTALLALPAHGRKRASSAEVQLARAYGYPERQIEKGIKAGSVRPLPGCSDPKDTDFFSRFRTFEEIEAWLKDRVCTLRGEIGSQGSSCELVTIGTSVEGRPIYAVEIRNPEAIAKARARWKAQQQQEQEAGRSGGDQDGNKKRKKKPRKFVEKVALVTGTLHAREWTATMSVLLSLLRLDVDEVSAFFVPVWNPDGYVHTWSGERGVKKRWSKGEVVAEEVPARMWRKNRRANDDGSVGVDLNRNFGSSDAIWGTDKKSKSINLTESDIFQGKHGWSEPETKAMRDYHAKYKKQVVALVDVHCCIGAVLEPFSRSGKTPDYVMDVGQMMIDAINRKAPAEERYEWRPRPASSASGSGISSSWANQEARIPFTYVVELRSKFVMPCTEIKPIANEFLLGLRVLMEQLPRSEEIIREYAQRAESGAHGLGAPSERRERRPHVHATVTARTERWPVFFGLGSLALAAVYYARAKSEPSKIN